MKKVFISTTTFGASEEVFSLLERAEITFTLNPLKRRLKEEEIREFLSRDNYVGLIAGTEPLTENVLTSSPGLKVISRVGVGLDNIDLLSAKRLGIRVYNTPDVVVDGVAELTLGLILCALRRLSLLDREVKNGFWNKVMGGLLKGKKVGIIGMGRIGCRVAEIISQFGSEVLFYDIKDLNLPFKKVTLEELLGRSDIISLHASGKSTIIGQRELSLMKKGVILINTARGNLIDEEALYRALKSGKVGFACLDVFSEEPYRGSLRDLDNVILTPHIGSYAKECRIEMEKQAVLNLLKGLEEVLGG